MNKINLDKFNALIAGAGLMPINRIRVRSRQPRIERELNMDNEPETSTSDFGARFLIAVAIEGWAKDHRLTLSPEVTGELQDAIFSVLQVDIESGVGHIVIERQRQVQEKGYTPEHDDEHDLGELGLAAALYALPYDAQIGDEKLLKQDDFINLHIALETGCGFYVDPEPDPVRRLAKAGALCAAEIDRLKRREKQNGDKDTL